MEFFYQAGADVLSPLADPRAGTVWVFLYKSLGYGHDRGGVEVLFGFFSFNCSGLGSVIIVTNISDAVYLAVPQPVVLGVRKVTEWACRLHVSGDCVFNMLCLVTAMPVLVPD